MIPVLAVVGMSEVAHRPADCPGSIGQEAVVRRPFNCVDGENLDVIHIGPRTAAIFKLQCLSVFKVNLTLLKQFV